jgi:hypothetical protein
MAQPSDKCTTFFVTDLFLCNFFDDVWPFMKEVNFIRLITENFGRQSEIDIHDEQHE